MINLSIILHQALALFEKKAFDKAYALVEKILTLSPTNAEALHLKGLILGSQGKTDDALFFLQKAVKHQPNNPYIHFNIGKAFTDIDQPLKSLTFFERAIKLLPKNSKFLYGYSDALYKANKCFDCISVCRRLLEGEPKNVDARVLLGRALHKIGETNAAIVFLEEVLNENIENEFAWNTLGLIFYDCRQYSDALKAFENAISANRNLREAWINKGATLNELDKTEKAEECFDFAIGLDDSKADAWINKSHSALLDFNHKRSLDYLKKAIFLEPENKIALANTAISLLALGDYENGWGQNENRWAIEGSEAFRHSEIPSLINPRDAINETVLVWAEQGFGDTIQFMRFIPWLQNKGCDVVFEVHRELKNLVSSNLSCKVISRDETTPRKPKYQIPLLSLPRVFRASPPFTPEKYPYISAADNRVDEWKPRIKKNKPNITIGLVCSGNPNHKNDARRSIPLEYFSGLQKLGEVFVLQKELRAQDATALSEMPNFHFMGSQINDFSETAAIIASLDLIITVDTATAHLARCYRGFPTHLILPFYFPIGDGAIHAHQRPGIRQLKFISKTNQGVG